MTSSERFAGKESCGSIPDPGWRLCRICGGSGLNEDWRGGDLVESWELCAACGGDGQFPARVPASDAMADAETLRLAWVDRARRLYGVPESFIVVFHTTAHMWRNAEILECYNSARYAARAAFRAVPGLRG